MANKAISELPQAQNVNNQDLFVLEQSGIAKKLAAETFITEQGIIDALAEALDGHGGISSVTLQSLSGRVRTYRITFTDGSATTFQVLDGTSIDRIAKTSTAGLVDTYTIFMSDGTTSFFSITNGADGDVSEATLNSELAKKAPVITETVASTAIATFADGADDMPMQNVVAEIEPVQDLTYGDPYPAGGGKNLFETTVTSGTSSSGITRTVADDGTLTISGSSTGLELCTVGTVTLPAATYVLNGMTTNSFSVTLQARLNDASGTTLATDSGSGATFTLESETTVAAVIRVPNGTTLSSTITISPMIRLSSVSDATFAPYSNICPITGHTEVNVTRTGKNLFNKNAPGINPGHALSPSTGSEYNAASYSVSDFIRVAPGSSYITSGIGDSCDACFYNSAKQRIAGVGNLNNGAVAPGNAVWIKIDYKTANANIVQLESNSTITSYEAYQGATATLSWQTEAGTVYGGTIDVATGLLTVTHALITLDGSQSLGNNGQLSYGGIQAYYTPLPAKANGYPSAVSDLLSNIFNTTTPFAEPFFINGRTTNGSIYFNMPETVTTTQQAKDWFSANNTQVWYKLATPQTYQLTPQEVKTLLGTNNVWADIGNVSVTYPADTKMFIENLTQPTEDDLVANQAITSGQYFMIGNSLYLALANIASGAQITIGTNAQRVSLADALNAINS